MKERKGKELPKGKPRGRGKRSSSTRSQHSIAHSHARSPSIQPVDWEERYHALFDRSLQYAIIQDFEGNILDANEVVLKLLGYDREDIPHLNIASLLSEDQLPKALAALQELKDTGMTKQVNEWRLKRKDGSFVDMLLSGALIYREGKPHAILGIGIDITERKRVEEALRQSEEKYRKLGEQSLMGLVINQDFRIIFANTAFTEIFGYSIDELLSLPPEKVQAMIHPEDQALVWGRFRDRLAGKAVPPHYEYRGIRKDGSICWLETYSNRIEYGGKPAIQQAIIDITERKRAEEALRLSEQNFRDSIEKSPLGIRIVSGDGKALYVNKTLLDICGYGNLEKLEAVPRNQLYTPESYAEHRERVNKRKRREYVPSNYEISIVRKDGQVRWLSVSRKEVLWDGEKQSQVVYQDITEHKQAEEALQERDERYRALFDRSLDYVYTHDFEGNFLDANETALKLLGYEREDIPHLNFASLVSEDQMPKALAALQELKDTGTQKQVNEFRLRCKDGSFVDMEVTAAVIYHEGKPYAIQGIGGDVTRRKKAEKALEKSEERYRQFAENAGEAIFVVQDGVIKFINPKGAELAGYSIEELVSKPFVQLIHPNDVDMVADRYARRLKGEAVPQIYNFRIIRKDGDIRWGELNAVPISWDNRAAVLCFASDVTERKRAEERLKESEQKYRTILEEMGDGYFETDLAGNLTFVNDEMTRRLGYSREELIGMNYGALRPKEESKAVFEAYNRMYKTGEPLRDFFTEIICKDGRHIFAETSAFPTRNEKGEIIGFRGIRRDITERKRAEEALRQSEERYRTILEEMEEGYYEVDLAGTFTFVNDAMTRILGYSRDELIGMNYKAYTPQESIKPIFQAYNRVYRTGEPLKWYPMTEFRKDGTLILAEDSVLPLRNEKGEVIGFRGISRNVTEHKKAEEALRQSEERYRAILEEMEDSYFEVDLGGNLTFVNNAVCRDLGYSIEELIGMSYKGFTAEDDINSVFRVFNEVYRTGVPNKGFPWKITRKDGTHGFAETSVSPLQNDKGEIIGFRGVGRDITERRKMEEQLILTDRLASVGQLAAGIAHELNNPLTGVIGFSDLLLERDFPADVKEDLETVNREAKRAVNIVKGLLSFAREQKTEKSLVNINIIIQGVLQIRSYEQRVSNIEVDARLAPTLPQVMGNGVQLQQVFINIIVNAEQAMTEAHGRGKLTIVTEQVGDMVRASITDDGPGISPADMKRLFTPFFTTREVGKGTGLGLSICHGIVTEHGGKIYVESELGKGATFVVELPISK
ncbi:MAG: PAS domain S-box protein [Dehalococcoidia bacterium]